MRNQDTVGSRLGPDDATTCARPLAGRMAELLTTYASLRLQVVDACIVALAERLDLREIATLDRRDLLVVAPLHLPKGERLTLLPAE